MDDNKELRDFFNKLEEYKGIGTSAKMIRQPVDIETWLNEEFYSGPSSKQLYAYWKRAIIKVFNSPTRINTVVITGSIGGGKTTAATYMFAYKIYELSCYFPPQALFNLMNDSKILFAYFNITKDIASQVGFGQLRDLIDSIPYFQTIFKRNDKINSMLEWKDSKMYVKSASSPNDVLGMNLIAFFMDEANFFKGDGTSNAGGSINDIKSKARVLYNSVRARGKSRFVVNNIDFTFSIIVSSSMYESSFTDEINVRASTRATSEGRERKRKLLGFFARGVARPASTHFFIRRSYSSFEPSQTTTLSGSHIFTHSSTQALILGFLISSTVLIAIICSF